MMLGKRPRPYIRRTTSMKEFVADLEVADDMEEPQPSEPTPMAEFDWLERSRMAAGMGGVLSPRYSSNHRRNSGEFMVVDTPFLKACGLCMSRLRPGRDIFMYRGEVAFCSLECRQQQINLDEYKEKCSLTSIKKESHPPPTTTTASEASGSGETMAVA